MCQGREEKHQHGFPAVEIDGGAIVMFQHIQDELFQMLLRLTGKDRGILVQADRI